MGVIFCFCLLLFIIIIFILSQCSVVMYVDMGRRGSRLEYDLFCSFLSRLLFIYYIYLFILCYNSTWWREGGGK